MVKSDITRFAPSPTGHLHLGHAFSAQFAAARGQRFLLRIEDIDLGRCRPQFIDDLKEDLHWMGLSWEEPTRCQSAHFSDYQQALDQLQAQDLLYPCFCTRADIARAGGAPQAGDHGPVYSGTCRHLSPSQRAERIAQGQPYALRLDLDKALQHLGHPQLIWHDETAGPQTATPQIFGDIVLARTARGMKEAGPQTPPLPASYHLCAVWDDALQGITLVTRGKDLFTATHIHRVLQELLHLPVPAYAHHPLLIDASGQRLAKRTGAPTLQSYRAQGLSPEAVWNMVKTAFTLS